MLKGLWGYVLFFVLCVGAAYWASLGGGERDELATEWLTIEAKELAGMTFKETDLNVAVEAKPFGYWVTVTETKKAPGQEKAEPKTEAFKSSKDIAELEGAFAPLMAQRVIGDSDKLDLKEFGLAENFGEWTVTNKAGKVYKFRVGTRSYGSRNVFLLDEEKKQVLMIAGLPLELLRNARSRLYERDIVHVNNDKLKKLAVTFGEAKANWLLGEKDKIGVPQWKEDKEGAQPQPSYKNWLDKVLKSKVQRFASEEERVALDGVEPFLTVAFFDQEGSELAKVMFKKYGESKDDKAQQVVWVESTYLGGGVAAQLNQNRALPIEKDIDSILKSRS